MMQDGEATASGLSAARAYIAEGKQAVEPEAAIIKGIHLLGGISLRQDQTGFSTGLGDGFRLIFVLFCHLKVHVYMKRPFKFYFRVKFFNRFILVTMLF